MEQSIFYNLIAKFFPKLQRLIERINGKREGLTYLHKTMLRREYSPDNKWESSTINTTFVAADYVSEDSSAPIKMRDSIGSANGKLPKIAIARPLKESDMTKIRIMKAQGGTTAQIAEKLAQDPIACATGIDERNEYAFLKGFSEGVVAVKDDENPNALMRLNFGYLPENSFGATSVGEVDLDDIYSVIEKANDNGSTITKIAIAKTTYDALRKTRKARQLAADYKGQSYDSSTELPVPSPTQFNDAFSDETNGVEFNIINRTVVTEQNGVRTKVKPWNPNRLVFYTSDIVGTLVYGRLAEQDNPVDGVNYQTIDNYKLIARFRETNPLREMTTGQAFAAPIIEDVDQIYVLDIANGASVDTEAEASDTADEKITINGVTYTKSAVITALKAVGKSVRVDASDEAVIKSYNSLSDAEEAQVLKAIESAKA